MAGTGNGRAQARKGLFGLLKAYRPHIALLVVLTVGANGLNLIVPRIIAAGIDAYSAGSFDMSGTLAVFVPVAAGIFVLTYLQSVVQTYASELVARDLRRTVAGKISLLDYVTVQKLTAAKLLTNLTSDVDAIKQFVAMAISSMVASAFLIVGASVLLLLMNWKLALVVLLVVPVVGGTFALIFRKIRKLFKRSQEAIDWLNRVINESILGAALVRLLDSGKAEHEKFAAANSEARDIGLSILRLFAGLIPVITFAANLATLTVLVLGGHFVISGGMTLGDFAAFNSYIAILIFPIIMLGFMSNVMARASASYGRVDEVLSVEDVRQEGGLPTKPGGGVALRGVSVVYGEKHAVKDVSFTATAGSRTAIIGPTAAGKTQLLYLLTGLISPDSGEVDYDGHVLAEYDPVSLHRRIAFVFQDSIIFNLSLRENIAFSEAVSDDVLAKAVAAAELSDFIATLPDGLDTVVSERGTSLSGGQKQRIMLARALALEPSVLLLDDFTARVDLDTERRILENVRREYPGITLISVTQKVAPVRDYDRIILLMEGELLAQGTHDELMGTSPEYVQIERSQRSTSNYGLRT